MKHACNNPIFWRVIWLLVLAVATGGCGRRNHQVRVPVHGRVTLQGKPVTAGTILFENAAAGVALMAPLEPDGSYSVKTYEGEGLPPGNYRVAVSPQRIATPNDRRLLVGPAPTSAAPAVSVVIPARYHDAVSSGLKAVVALGEDAPFDFDLAP